MADVIQLRRGAASAWTSANPTLAQGEIGLETDTGKFKVGDGTTAWNSQTYWAVGLNVVNVFSKNQSVTPSALTSGTTIALDASLSNNFKLVLAHNATLSNPTNPTDGMVLNIRIKQDATGSRTLAYGSKYKFPGGAPALSTAANTVDFLSMYYDSTDDLWSCVLQKAFA